ncbi:MAG TPA: APC family permease [Candidatus Limnocylindrales bacterium]|nr:APC family permease [Candidatus Limnocylindrales bacterium]
MASTSEVRVFARQATGLTKDIGTLDTFIYNVNNQNIGIGVAFILLFVPGFYVGADLYQGIFIAMFLALPMALVYAFFASAIPRSGGDYVYISRTLHPLLGFVSSWNWVAWMIVYVGVPAAYFAQYGLSGLFRSLGVVTGNPDLIAFGNNFVDPVWILAVGTLLIVFFASIFILGTRIYFRLQNVVFAIGMIGVAAALGLGIMGSSADFGANFDAYVSAAGGVANASANVVEPAPYDATQTLYSSTLALFITLFAITSSFLGGEVRQARVAQFAGMPGGVIFVSVFMLLIVAVVVNLVGLPLLGGISAQYFSPGDGFGLAFVPTYNELIVMAFRDNVLVALLLGFTFVFWTYVWLPINFLASTRALLAWSLDGLMPRRLSEVSEERHTPTVAIIVVAILGWFSLFMYTIGIGDFKINTLYGIFGWILSFLLCSIAAIVFPYKLRSVFESSPVNWRVAGIPVMSIVGVIATVALLIVEYIWWFDPVNGLDSTTAVLGDDRMKLITLAVLASGAIWYIVARYVQASRGVRIDRAFAEIPPE